MLAATTAFRYHDLSAVDGIGPLMSDPLGRTVTVQNLSRGRFRPVNASRPEFAPFRGSARVANHASELVLNEHGEIMAEHVLGGRAKMPIRIIAPPMACSSDTGSPRRTHARAAAAIASMKITSAENAAGKWPRA